MVEGICGIRSASVKDFWKKLWPVCTVVVYWDTELDSAVQIIFIRIRLYDECVFSGKLKMLGKSNAKNLPHLLS